MPLETFVNGENRGSIRGKINAIVAAVNSRRLVKLTGEQIYNRAIAAPFVIFTAIWVEFNKLVFYGGDGVFRDGIGASVIVYSVPGVITLVSLEPIANIQVVTGGVEPSRPTTINATFSDSSVVPLSVSWSSATPTFNTNTLGNYVYTGVVTLPNGITNPLNLAATLTVVVAAQPAITIASVAVIASVNTPFESNAPTLPPNVDVTLSNSNVISMAIVWGASNPVYNSLIAGNYVYQGVLTLPPGITNPLNLTATRTTIVDAQLPEFVFTLRTTVANEEIFVPVMGSKVYNMQVNWGGGVITTYNKTGVFQDCKRTVTAPAGTEFIIKLSGADIPQLGFGSVAAFTRNTLKSIDKNTLTTSMTLLTANGCAELLSVSADMYQNITTQTTIDFNACSKLATIGAGFGATLLNKGITRLSFQNCLLLANLSPTIFANVNFGNASNILSNTIINTFPTSLRVALTNATNLSGMLTQTAGTYTIPNNLFDLMQNNSVTDVQNLFSGTLGTVTGDAKALYDVLVLKATAGSIKSGAFGRTQLSNRNQVPTTWGGTLV